MLSRTTLSSIPRTYTHLTFRTHRTARLSVLDAALPFILGTVHRSMIPCCVYTAARVQPPPIKHPRKRVTRGRISSLQKFISIHPICHPTSGLRSRLPPSRRLIFFMRSPPFW
jgi:hypothetical protein